MEWPRGFMWGTGASSTQCEGAAPASDWWDWERKGRAPVSGNGNGFAERFAEDFAALSELGLTHHRLSLEWARLEPEEGRRDDTAISHYRDALHSARDAGVTPWVCLHHFTLPRWFARAGGFLIQRNRTTHWRRRSNSLLKPSGISSAAGSRSMRPTTTQRLRTVAGAGPRGTTTRRMSGVVVGLLATSGRYGHAHGRLTSAHGKAISTRTRAEVAVEGSVLLLNDNDVLDLVDPGSHCVVPRRSARHDLGLWRRRTTAGGQHDGERRHAEKDGDDSRMPTNRSASMRAGPRAHLLPPRRRDQGRWDPGAVKHVSRTARALRKPITNPPSCLGGPPRSGLSTRSA
jgi:hypothetical protein